MSDPEKVAERLGVIDELLIGVTTPGMRGYVREARDLIRDLVRERDDAYKTIRVLTGAEEHVACPSLSCPFEARFQAARAALNPNTKAPKESGDGGCVGEIGIGDE